MKKTLISLVLMGTTFIGTTKADEIQQFYLTIGGGSNIFLDTDYDETLDGVKYQGDVEIESNFSFDGGIGYDFGKWRTEITYQSMPADLDSISAEKVIGSVGVTASASGDVDLTSYLATIYYDLPDYKIGDKTLMPYIGAGLGTTNIDIGTITVDGISTGGGDDNAIAFQLKLGSSMAITEKTDLYVEGVYFSTGDFEILGTNFDPIKSLGLRSGVRFRF